MDYSCIDKKIKEITDKIVKKYKPEKIILFGSYAWGKPHEWSDVDLFIVKNSKRRKIDRQRYLHKILFGNNFPPMDILVYTPSEVEESINKNRNLFIEDIVRNGKVLFTKPRYNLPILCKPGQLVA